LQRQGGDVFGHFRHRDIKPFGRSEEPGQVTLLATDQILLRPVPEKCAIVQELSGIVSPAGIMHGSDRQLPRITQGKPVEIADCVLARDAVFHHRA
jgi:hypothetical protein